MDTDSASETSAQNYTASEMLAVTCPKSIFARIYKFVGDSWSQSEYYTHVQNHVDMLFLVQIYEICRLEGVQVSLKFWFILSIETKVTVCRPLLFEQFYNFLYVFLF